MGSSEDQHLSPLVELIEQYGGMEALAQYFEKYGTSSNKGNQSVVFRPQAQVFRCTNTNNKTFVLELSDALAAVRRTWTKSMEMEKVTPGQWFRYIELGLDKKALEKKLSSRGHSHFYVDFPNTKGGAVEEYLRQAIWDRTLLTDPKDPKTVEQTCEVFHALAMSQSVLAHILIATLASFLHGLSTIDADKSLSAEPSNIVNRSHLTLSETLEKRGLVASDHLLAALEAALSSGKHILLTGPPGTGKTSIAEALATLAAQYSECFRYSMATGTSDWSPQDTVGGYWLTTDQQMEFQPGVVVRSMIERKWLVIDELNRADLDKSFGPLFTLLSGHDVSLPYEIDGEQVLLTASQTSAGGPHVIRVPSGWRMIGTMNTWDRDALFEMSFALQRRFVTIDVPALPPDEAVAVVRESTSVDDEEILDAAHCLAMVSVEGFPSIQLGTAVLIDFVSFLRHLREDGSNSMSMVHALGGTVLHQYGHLPRRHREAVLIQVSETLQLDEVQREKLFDLASLPSPPKMVESSEPDVEVSDSE